MSRSVTMPMRRPLSTIGTEPTSSRAITLAASTSVAVGSHVVGLLVITSLT
jgi:hypothetical protein